MTFNKDSTLQELEGTTLGEPEFGSRLVTRVHHLYKQPLATFTVEDLRLMIGQGVGLPFLVPLAVEMLEENPLAGGDYYHGDLLVAVLRVDKEFWKKHQDLYWRVTELTTGLPSTLEEVKHAILAFDDGQFDS